VIIDGGWRRLADALAGKSISRHPRVERSAMVAGSATPAGKGNRRRRRVLKIWRVGDRPWRGGIISMRHAEHRTHHSQGSDD
jgi:hypothetical protein